jgi:glycolate oxidase FAD binding subunit
LSAPATWPEPPAGGPLGDGRLALERLRPAQTAELCEVVREQVALGHAIYPQGGQTALNYGGIPRRVGVAIETTALDQLIDYPYADMTITVGAGMTLSGLRQILAREGQRLLIDAPFPDRATLGGIYATDTSGSRRYGAGRPRDQIIGVSFVTSEGVVVKGGGRVVKNVAGYDFPKLLTGSMGTLGIITQLTLKVRPIPEASAIAWVPFSSGAKAAHALEALNTSGTCPIAIDLLNSAAASPLARGLGLPSADLTLVIGYEDNAQAVRWQIDRLKDELEAGDVVVIEGETTAALWDALTQFQAQDLGPISFVASLRPSQVLTFVNQVDREGWAVHAHAGSGIVRAHVTEEWTLDAAVSEIDRHREAARQGGGDLILARCPTDWKERLRVWGLGRADWSIAERVKAALDPHAAMNPGRFVGTI